MVTLTLSLDNFDFLVISLSYVAYEVFRSFQFAYRGSDKDPRFSRFPLIFSIN
jgi:hypothetical protein